MTAIRTKRLTYTLPPAACTEEMFEAVRQQAEAEHSTVSQVIRSALLFYLSEHSSDSIKLPVNLKKVAVTNES